MLVHIDVNSLFELGLTADQYVWLKLIATDQENTANKFLNLIGTDKLPKDYLMTTEPLVINKKKLKELFSHTSDNYFLEFFSTYPIKVSSGKGGIRMLRTMRSDTKLGEDIKKRYEKVIRTLEQHKFVMRCLDADLEHRRRTNTLMYMPSIEAYVNGQDWEKAEYLLELSNLHTKDIKHGEGLI